MEDAAPVSPDEPAPAGHFLGAPIRNLHLEITSRCTLECPRCQRNANPEELEVNDVPLAVLRRTLTRANFPTIDFVNFAGNYGDPIYHRQFHAVIRHVKAEGLKVRIETNGSYRSRAWWDETASILGRPDRIALSIDGLEDTNHIYRVKSRWRDITAAIEALRGRVCLIWKFIVFRHNQHQVAEAERRARALGFDEFRLIRSHRFDGRWRGPDGVDPMKPDEEWVSDRLRVSNRVMEVIRDRR
jgi:MoaA/NifB/PqqE/SkfB family radical SAM enzyme